MADEAKPFTNEEIAFHSKEHEICGTQCHYARWHATIRERDSERDKAIAYLLRATAMTQPPSTAPSKLIAMAAIAAQHAKDIHDGMHDAVAATAAALTRAEDAEAAVRERDKRIERLSHPDFEDFITLLDEFLCSDKPCADSGARFTAALRAAREILR